MYLDADITGESFDSIYSEIEINFEEQHYETVLQLCDILLDRILPTMSLTEKELNERLLSIFYYKGESLVFTENVEDSIEYYSKAIELAEILKDSETEIELILTYLEVVIQNQLEREIDSYFKRCADLYEVFKDENLLLQCYALKAIYAFNSEQFDETIKLCQLYERFRLKATETQYDLEVASILIRSNNAIGQEKIALEHSINTLKEFEILKRTEKYCELLVNHGLLLFNDNQSQHSIDVLQDAIVISDEEGFSNCSLNALYIIGFIHFSNEMFEHSLSTGLSYLQRNDKELIPSLLAEVIIFVGVSYLKLELFSECLLYIDTYLENTETIYYLEVFEKLTMIKQMVAIHPDNPNNK